MFGPPYLRHIFTDVFNYRLQSVATRNLAGEFVMLVSHIKSCMPEDVEDDDEVLRVFFHN